MSQVFISYRQTDEAQNQRVRAFAERLRAAGVDVILDQFFLDDNPEGPAEGWDKWSSDRALKTEYVIIVGTQDWFECFEKTQPAKTGYGAACEADDIRSRIYKSAGVIKTIRVVLFDDAATAFIPAKLDRYHRFHFQRDLSNIRRWLGGRIDSDDKPRTSIPHNLPRLQPFFGREEELKKIADALDPESRTWGALIDGPGGMGKTSLAVRAAYDAPPEDFEKIIFISLKSRELDDDGVRDLSSFLISGLAELLNELARELGHAEITKAPEEQRPRMLLDALRGTRALLVLDNLEGLIKKDRDTVFTFVKKLPAGCKAILTSRQRIGSAAEELILEKLSESAALATLAKLAETNQALAKTSEAERLELYRETGGKPLLLCWTAGQIGRGSCLTLSDSIAYLRSCPEENDPLEFIFGDLVDDFTNAESSVLCALTYFTLPAKVEHIAELAGYSNAESDRALRSLVNRSLVLPNEELKTFVLVPLVGDFLRKKKPEVIADTAVQLENRAYVLIEENGYEKHERFDVLEAAWPIVAAALPGFLTGPNNQLQAACRALRDFFIFTGRFDELLALNRDAESHAVSAKDFLRAGWRAHETGWVHYLRLQTAELLTCADRAESHWRKADAGSNERAAALHLRGIGHLLADDYSSAASAFREAVELWRSLDSESAEVVTGLIALAKAQQFSGEFDAAEHGYREAWRIARMHDDQLAIAAIPGHLSVLALVRDDFLGAEAFAREALSLSEALGSQEAIALSSHRLAKSLVLQGKKVEALPHAERAVVIYTRLGLSDLSFARAILSECKS